MVWKPCTSLTTISCFNHSRIKKKLWTSLNLVQQHIFHLSYGPCRWSVPFRWLASQKKLRFSPCTSCLGFPLIGSPLLATPGTCKATHILSVAQDGDTGLSHFHWKTTASGCHRCQQGARGVALATMLLAVAAAVIGKTGSAFIFCLAPWPAGNEELLHHVAHQSQRQYVFTFGIRCKPPPWWLQLSLGLRWPLGAELTS